MFNAYEVIFHSYDSFIIHSRLYFTYEPYRFLANTVIESHNFKIEIPRTLDFKLC